MPEQPQTKVLSRSARQALVTQLLERNVVSSQAELTELLAKDGVAVTQGTVSKDLVELGAIRTRDADGTLRYVVSVDERADSTTAATRLAKLCSDVLLSAEASANLVVARTPPGAAQYFASALDRADWHEILGTIAGDDTVLLICRDPAGGENLAARLSALATQSR